MAYPYRFESGQIARAEELNTNFDYILDIIGSLSTPGSIEGQSTFILGPRQLSMFTAKQDTSADANAFTQQSWNTSWNPTSGVYKFARILPNQPASATRLGRAGFSYHGTSALTGDLNTQMKKVFGFTPDYGFIRDDVHVQNIDGAATTLQHYRMMRVFLETPIKIYGGWVGTGVTVMKAYNLGVPNYAKGVIIYAHLTPANASGAGMHFYQKRSVATTDLVRARGFVIHGYAGNTALGRVGGQGDVPLSSAGEFVIERTASFELAKVYIIGYLT